MCVTVQRGQPMSGPRFGIIPRRVAGLRLPGREHAVLDVIAIHTDKNSGLAWPSLETIARETGLHKRKVPGRIRRLVDRGVLEIVRHGGHGFGGRGRANLYRIILDEEAARRTSQPAAETDNAAAAIAVNGALPGPEAAAENGALFDFETVPFSTVNGALQGTQQRRNRIRASPSERDARARMRRRCFDRNREDDAKPSCCCPWTERKRRRPHAGTPSRRFERRRKSSRWRKAYASTTSIMSWRTGRTGIARTTSLTPPTPLPRFGGGSATNEDLREDHRGSAAPRC